MMVFIEIFFLQRDMQRNNPLDEMLSALWIYTVLTAMHTLGIVWTVGKSMCTERHLGWVGVGMASGGMGLGTVQWLFRLDTARRGQPYYPLGLHCAGCVMLLLYCVVYQGIQVKVRKDWEGEDAAIQAEENRIEERVETKQIPYAFTRVSEGGLYRPADRYDLLRMVVGAEQAGEEKAPSKAKLSEYSKARITLDSRERRHVPMFSTLRSKFLRVGVDREGSEGIGSSRQSVQAMASVGEGSHPPEMCFVCCSNKQCTVNYPCGHGGQCGKCAAEVWIRGKGCYLCKAPVEIVAEIEDEVQGVGRVTRIYLQTPPAPVRRNHSIYRLAT